MREESVQWFRWLGTRGLLTPELHARCDGIPAETDLDRWHRHLESIHCHDRNAHDLAQHMTVKTFEKFDEALVEDVLDQTNVRDRLDLPFASARAAYARGTLQEPATGNPAL